MGGLDKLVCVYSLQRNVVSYDRMHCPDVGLHPLSGFWMLLDGFCNTTTILGQRLVRQKRQKPVAFSLTT